MPFTATEIATFFTNTANMGLLLQTTGAFAAEGITKPVDLTEFNKEGILSIFHNLCKPAKVLCAGATGVHGKLQEIMADKPSAKLLICLTIAAQAARFYEDTGQELNPNNILWSVIKRFDEQFKVLMAWKVRDSSYVPPKLMKNFSTHKWLELFVFCHCQKVGVRDCPLKYIVHELATVAVLALPILAGEPHSEEHGGSINGNMIARTSHSHPLF